ncbi:MAG: uncharacterized protein QOG04_2050 [Actinomycetota bacterium]|jgi:uncharacterized membrane protein YqgA involved in biofilm formation|nr:uncharacterized protein [Actinomycetota bacterium]
MRGLGTVINLATVLVGGIVGVYAGHRFPERMRLTMMQGLGLATIAIAVVGFEPLVDDDLGLRRAVIMIGAVTVGAVIGEALGIEERLEGLGDRLRKRFAPNETKSDTVSGHSRFVEGFVIASMVFCAGPMTLLGATEDGLGISIRLLAIKSTLDGIAAIGFASVYGWGVLASLLVIAVYQGLVTALAVVIEPILTAEVLAELSLIGSLLLLGIGLRLLAIKEIKVLNLIPALLLGPLAAGIVDALL